MEKFNGIEVPADGQKITVDGDRLKVPDRPIIPFIEGDGIGRDIWRASQRVFDAAVEKAFDGKRSVAWFEIFAGEKAFNAFGEWLPEDSVKAIAEFAVAIKGPLTTPVGGGIRSLNVTLRQVLDLYACVRPVRYFEGVPSPVKLPERVNVVIFRENTEDVYAGIEFPSGSERAAELISLLNDKFGYRVRTDSGIGIKPMSPTGTKRLVRRAIRYALEFGKPSVTLVHKGNIMKYTEGAFRDWGYELAKEEFRNETVTERETWILENREKNASITDEENARMIEPGFEQMSEKQRAAAVAEVKETLAAIGNSHGNGEWKKKLLIKDRIADSIFQQILIRPEEYSILATPNLNGDYLSDAAAAQVGGLGMAPGANIGDKAAVFEATHGTAPKYADKDVINPSSVILSGVMMFDHIGWREVGSKITDALTMTIRQKRVTYDLERQMEGATKVKTSEFASAIIENM
ncbi:MAG TPA: NADP-dependent isocitrate dehydrogenase [Blastocatellia bacterium]|jgi:isocitrate dehydrogenase|nr:NADP-dependent isocitrate dehydrogenase [Blastocatellia bacterium]